LKVLLSNLWGAQRLSQGDKARITDAVTSIVDQSQIKEALEATRAFWHERWESDPWYKGSTANRGEAVVKQVEDALDWTRGNEPPAFRDWISNREYLVRVQKPGMEEEIRVVMKPGNISRGKSFAVRIRSITRPVYVETD
jgi:hypothetical protein